MAKAKKTTKKAKAKKTTKKKTAKKTTKKKAAKKKKSTAPVIRDHKDLVHNIGDLAAEFTNDHKGAEAVIGGSTLVDSIVNRWIPTGCPNFDSMLQGGFPCGRVTQIFGGESTGKSTLVQSAMIQCTKMGGIAILLDPEQSFDPDRFRRMGGDPDAVILIQKEYDPSGKKNKKEKAIGIPSLTVQDVFKYIHDILNSIVQKPQWQGRPIFVALDSLDNITTDEALAGEKDGMGKKPRLIREGFRKITAPIAQLGACFVIVSQTIENIGGYGAKITTSGGGGPKFIASVRITTKKHYRDKNDFYTKIPEGTSHRKTGQLLTEATVIKNKLNRAYTTSVTAINNDSSQYYEGIDPDMSLLYGLGDDDLLTKAGQSYRYIKINATTEAAVAKAKELGLEVGQEYPFIMSDWRAWVSKYPAIREWLKFRAHEEFKRPDIFKPEPAPEAEEEANVESGQAPDAN